NNFWCPTWTDYHNTVASAALHSMRTGEVQWIDELTIPGALRTLHTQIFQCSPSDNYFYCGQSPAGYGAYRANFNSSHAYFFNLFTYYWLTGDGTVVEILQRGASRMRNYLCSRRPAAACGPNDPTTDPSARLAGRVSSQWFAAFRFVGLASEDASFLDDWRGNMGRAATRHYAALQNNGQSYGFWTDSVIGGAGSHRTGQLWMVSLYDMRNMERLMRDTADAPIGSPAVRPSEVLISWARTLEDYGARVAGNGTAAGVWPNQLDFSFSGARIGGNLSSVSGNVDHDNDGQTCDTGDECLWSSGKATLCTVVVNAGLWTSNLSMTALGRELTERALGNALTVEVLNKRQGLYMSRLHEAVKALSE
ncbi:MAG: hypothetical protein KC492_40245, partial [Myxococcales bacterium]|nr:hypothetical protein [Myxococcales bacterium]